MTTQPKDDLRGIITPALFAVTLACAGFSVSQISREAGETRLAISETTKIGVQNSVQIQSLTREIDRISRLIEQLSKQD